MAFISKATVMVYNIPWSVGQRELQKYFTKFGPVKSAKILYDFKTGFSKSFGIVTFNNEEIAMKAIGYNKHFLESYELMVTSCDLEKLQMIKSAERIA